MTSGGTLIVWALSRWWLLPKFGLAPPSGIGLGEVTGAVIAAISAYYFGVYPIDIRIDSRRVS